MSAKEKSIWTVVDIIRWGTEYFGAKGVDSPRLTIELLVTDVLKCTRLQLYLMHDRPLTEKELSILRETCTRRAKREPLQYILGKAHFYGLEFDISPAVLIPRPETETLIDTVLKYCASMPDPLYIIDIGTGSGCIAITLAQHLKHRTNPVIQAMDVSKEALEIAKKNAQFHNVEIVFEHCDLFQRKDPLKGIVVSNPPYISIGEYAQLEPELMYEPKVALTDNADGLAFYKKISDLIRHSDSSVQAFFLELGYGQMVDVENFFKPVSRSLNKVHDLSGIERVLWGEVNAML